MNALYRFGRTLGDLLGHYAIPEMAAALAYRTIFSLIPILLIAFLTLRLFKDTSKMVEDFLGKVLAQTGLSSIGSDAGSSFSLQVWISERVRDFSGINFTWIGMISAGVLIYAAIGLLVALEGAFNSIYGGQVARAWGKRFLQYWMIITLGPMLVYASFYAGDSFTQITRDVTAEQGGIVAATLLAMAGYATTVIITAGLLLALYITIPNARVALRPATIGALVGAVLLEMAKNAFSIYVKLAGVNSLYGSLALLPLFMFWIYITWIIVLFGLRLSYLIQHHRVGLLWQAWRGVLRRHLAPPLTASMPEQAFGPLLLDRSVALTMLAHIASAFNAGRAGLTAEQIETEASIPLAAVKPLLEKLRLAGLLTTQGGSGRSARFMLRRPAETILVVDALRAVDELVIEARSIGRMATLERAMTAAAERAVAGLTLADLVLPPKRPGGESPLGPEFAAANASSPPVPA